MKLLGIQDNDSLFLFYRAMDAGSLAGVICASIRVRGDSFHYIIQVFSIFRQVDSTARQQVSKYICALQTAISPSISQE